MAHEAEQDAFQLLFSHLAVSHADAGVGDQLLNGRGAGKNRIDAVVQEIHLSTALQFLIDGGADQLRIEVRDHGMNRQAILGRSLDHAHVANAQHRHMQRARNRRGAHGQDVDIFSNLLQPLLVADAEALLFVDDHQAEIAKFDVFLKAARCVPMATSTFPAARSSKVA